jgi:hypothetical protein
MSDLCMGTNAVNKQLELTVAPSLAAPARAAFVHFQASVTVQIKPPRSSPPAKVPIRANPLALAACTACT